MILVKFKDWINYKKFKTCSLGSSPLFSCWESDNLYSDSEHSYCCDEELRTQLKANNLSGLTETSELIAKNV